MTYRGQDLNYMQQVCCAGTAYHMEDNADNYQDLRTTIVDSCTLLWQDTMAMLHNYCPGRTT
jgi:hypothetical protein